VSKKKYIETPEKLWQLFKDYKKEVKSNPIIVKDWVCKDATDVYREKERPLIMVGFECYCMEHTPITYPDLSDYFENKDNRFEDYLPITSRIKQEIKADQLSGGMTMIYSQNLTARLNGLVDKKETEIKGSLNIPNVPDIGNRE
jgi:hypothetical protein